MRSLAVAEAQCTDGRHLPDWLPEVLKELILAESEWRPLGSPVKAAVSISEHTAHEDLSALIRRLVSLFDASAGSASRLDVKSSSHVFYSEFPSGTSVVGRGKVLHNRVFPDGSFHVNLAIQVLTEEEQYPILTAYYSVVCQTRAEMIGI